GIVSLNLLIVGISILLFIIPLTILLIFNRKKIEIASDIDYGNFIIQKDKIDEINKTLDYRSTYRLRTLTFKKYKKELRVPKKEFVEVKKNDDVYLVLNKKKEVIRCYNAKYVQFDKELEDYIK
ncbi:MAG: hypothetical protein Q4E69_06935, partial [Bacilli bacterium]|nr:hypothetical protein [Bacilli bacterium]